MELVRDDRGAGFEVPNTRTPELNTAIGMLLMRLASASRDTGQGYRIEFYPINEQYPDQYTFDLAEYTPVDAA